MQNRGMKKMKRILLLIIIFFSLVSIWTYIWLPPTSSLKMLLRYIKIRSMKKLLPNHIEQGSTNPVAVLRSAFIDMRNIDGHQNRTVILAERHEEVLIDSCGVDGVESKAFKVVPLYFFWVQWTYPELTHEEVMIFCYDLSVTKNSMAFVRYHSTKLSTPETITVNVTYTKRRKESEYKNKVVVCTIGFDKPPLLKEWLIYQKAIGVNLIQMYAEELFIYDGQNQKIIESFVQEGFLKIENRKTFYGENQIYYHSQILNYHDCLYRYQEIYEFAFFIDTDDFFIPRLENISLGYYLNRMFSKDQAEIRFWWHRFFPDCGYTQPLSSLKNGNVTAILAYKDSVTESYSETKFVCRPMLTTLTAVHSTLGLLEGMKSSFGDDSEAYVAHVRLNRLKDIPDRSKCNITNS